MQASDFPLEFPPLFEFEEDRWQWPLLPFAWRHEPVAGPNEIQACRIEMVSGEAMDGQMLQFDGPGRSLVFRRAPGGVHVPVPFDPLRRLTLAMPLHAAPKYSDGPLDVLPAASHERHYVLQPRGPGAALTGRTVGYVETADGMFLFAPVSDDAALLRVFAPKGSYAECLFSATAIDIAAREWAYDPPTLLEALAQRHRKPVIPLGRAILALGLTTAQQLEGALRHQPGGMPLGEILVSRGVITGTELQAAIAHKMGCPVVDLRRFPISLTAVGKLSQRLAVTYGVLPLMLDGERLLIAAEEIPSDDKQRSIQLYSRLQTVAVLAHADHMRAAFAALPADAWSDRLI